AAVVGVAAVVAHGEVAILRHHVGKLHFRTAERSFAWVGRLGGSSGIAFAQLFAVNPDGAVAKVHAVAGQADDAFDEVGGIRRVGRLEDNHLLAFGIAPEREMPLGERNAGIVADAAHDEVIADEQSALHGT